MNRYDLECLVRKKYPEIFDKEDWLNVRNSSRSNIKWIERHKKVFNAERTNYNWEADPNIYYFYHDRLFAILQRDCPLYPGELTFMLMEVEDIPINALVNGIRLLLNVHTPYMVVVKGMNTGTYKVIKIDDQPFKYVGRGSIIRLKERPTLMTEEFVPYKRPEMLGEPNSDW